MSKDPAFMFYTQDFVMGTLLMNNEEIGIYVKLLCVQHQHGGIIDKIAFSQIVQDNRLVKSKFVETEEGFYNKRLMEEMHKREVKSSNLSESARETWKKRKSSTISVQSQYNLSTTVMRAEDEDEDEDRKKKLRNKVFKIPTVEEVSSYCAYRSNNIDASQFVDYYTTRGWMIGKNKIKDWKSCIRTWERNNYSSDKEPSSIERMYGKS